MFAGRCIAVATAVSMVACSTTERISGASLNALRYGGPSTRSLVLEDPNGTRIRLDPNSEIRFLLRDGRRTDWIQAGGLAVTGDGRIIDGDRQLPIDQVETVEIENVDGVKTYFLTLGIVAVAAALIAMAVISAEGGDSSSSSSDGQPRIATGGTQRTRAPRVGGSAWIHADPWLYPGQPAPGFVVPVGGAPAGPPAPVESPNQLFSTGAIRRSSVATLLQLELGYGFDERTGGGMSVGAGFAFAHMFELTGGFRLNDLAGPQQISMGFVRAGGNFPFEAGDGFGAPIALDVAFNGQGFAQMRVLWGFRWRFGGQFEIALLPANPQLNRVNDQLYWDFPSQVQVGYRF